MVKETNLKMYIKIAKYVYLLTDVGIIKEKK